MDKDKLQEELTRCKEQVECLKDAIAGRDRTIRELRRSLGVPIEGPDHPRIHEIKEKLAAAKCRCAPEEEIHALHAEWATISQELKALGYSDGC